MKTEDIQSKNIKRGLNKFYSRLISGNCMFVHANEAEYLMSGYASELIDSIWVNENDINSYAKIYGVVAADRSQKRYVWIYLVYDYHLWKCFQLKDAYAIVEKIKLYNRLQYGRMHKKTKAKILQLKAA